MASKTGTAGARVNSARGNRRHEDPTQHLTARNPVHPAPHLQPQIIRRTGSKESAAEGHFRSFTRTVHEAADVPNKYLRARSE